MAVNSYQIGDKVTLRAAFKVAGVGVDPTNVQFKVIKPDGTVITYVYPTNPEVVKESAGNYYLLYVVDRSGYWLYRIAGTGTNESAAWQQFYVQPDPFNVGL